MKIQNALEYKINYNSQCLNRIQIWLNNNVKTLQNVRKDECTVKSGCIH